MPLFNFSSNLHSSSLSILFDQHFSQWVVGKTLVHFPRTGDSKEKYFVVVNADSLDEDVLMVLLNSEPKYLLAHPILKTHVVKMIPAECDNLFPKECYADCTEFILMKRETILSRFISNPQILLGKLPENISKMLKERIIGSHLIPVEYQEKVYK